MNSASNQFIAMTVVLLLTGCTTINNALVIEKTPTIAHNLKQGGPL